MRPPKAQDGLLLCLALSSAGCGPSCDEGFGLAADGNCYPLAGGDDSGPVDDSGVLIVAVNLANGLASVVIVVLGILWLSLSPGHPQQPVGGALVMPVKPSWLPRCQRCLLAKSPE